MFSLNKTLALCENVKGGRSKEKGDIVTLFLSNFCRLIGCLEEVYLDEQAKKCIF